MMMMMMTLSEKVCSREFSEFKSPPRAGSTRASGMGHASWPAGFAREKNQVGPASNSRAKGSYLGRTVDQPSEGRRPIEAQNMFQSRRSRAKWQHPTHSSSSSARHASAATYYLKTNDNQAHVLHVSMKLLLIRLRRFHVELAHHFYKNWGHNAAWDMPRCADLAQSGIELVEVSRCLPFKECLEKSAYRGCQRPRSHRHRSFASPALQFSRECAWWVRCISSRLSQLRIFRHTVVSPPPATRAPVEKTMVCCNWSCTLCRALVFRSSRTGSGAAGSVIAGSYQALPRFVPSAHDHLMR